MECPAIDFDADQRTFPDGVIDQKIDMRPWVGHKKPFALRQIRHITDKPREWRMTKAA